MNPAISRKALYVHLEFARGIAALIVLAGHLKAFIFVDYGEVVNPGVLEKIFYFIAGLGHQAVMVFFVLSGFLITRSVESMVARNAWSWKAYLINRLSRLWTVLIPALVLTMIWDYAGREVSGSSYYLGQLNEFYNSGPGLQSDLSIYGILTFLQNVLFLQTITAQPYGTNGPLWSLAYEFWYYIIFPLGYTLVVYRDDKVNRLFRILLLGLIFYILPVKILLGGLVWMLGYLVGILDRRESLHYIYSNIVFSLVALALFGASLIIARTGVLNRAPSDIIVGITFGMLMLGMIHRQSSSSIYHRVSDFLSNISYTLYLVHFPLLGFISSVYLSNRQYQPEQAIQLYSGLFVLAIAYASLIYYLFERNTSLVRRYVAGLLGR